MLEEYEVLKKYINFKFTEKSNSTIYNPWEMFSRASKISSFIYKSKVIDSLKLYCNKNDKIAIKNIFIVNNDYIKEYQIKYLLNDLNSNKKYEALNKIFSYGQLYFMIPNFFYLRLYEIYEFKFELNNITKDYQFKCIAESKFNDLIDKYFKSSSLSSIDLIDNLTQIAEKRLKKIKNDKIIYQMLRKINDLSYEYKDKIKLIRDFEKSPEKKEIEKLIFQNKISNLEDERLIYYYKKYYNKFNMYFNNSRKPIVGIFNEGSIGTFDIFSKYSLIYYPNYKLNFINLKKLSHSSPLVVEIATGLGIIASTIFGIFEGINRIKKGILENKEKELDIEHKKIGLLEKELELKKKYLENQIDNCIEDITNNFKLITKNYKVEIIDNKALDDE